MKPAGVASDRVHMTEGARPATKKPMDWRAVDATSGAAESCNLTPIPLTVLEACGRACLCVCVCEFLFVSTSD